MAKTRTLHDRLVDALTGYGSAIDPTKVSQRHTVLTHPTRKDRWYFVGKAGGLRLGTSATNSISLAGLRDDLLRRTP
jgi:hypothetical protein